MSENKAVPQPVNTARIPSSTDTEFREKSLDAVVVTPPAAASVVNISDPTPGGEDFDA
jgi:hypothetical protein